MYHHHEWYHPLESLSAACHRVLHRAPPLHGDPQTKLLTRVQGARTGKINECAGPPGVGG